LRRWTSLERRWKKKNNSILKLPSTKEWHDKSDHSQRPPSRPPKRWGSGHRGRSWVHRVASNVRAKPGGKQRSWHLCW
jgi:hypothetical protein